MCSTTPPPPYFFPSSLRAPISISNMSSEGRLYGGDDFNPKLIITQMLCLQSLWYCGLCVTSLPLNYPSTFPVVTLFSSDHWHVKDRLGMAHGVGVLLCTILLAFACAVIVERSRKCWDFVGSVFIVHLLLVSVCQGYLPSEPMWWSINVLSAVLSTLGGEYLCSRTETESILLRPSTRPKRSGSDLEARPLSAPPSHGQRARAVSYSNPC